MHSYHLLLFLLLLYHSIITEASPVKPSGNSQSKSSFTPTNSSMRRLNPAQEENLQGGTHLDTSARQIEPIEEIPPGFSPLHLYEQKPRIYHESLAKKAPQSTSSARPNLGNFIDLDTDLQPASSTHSSLPQQQPMPFPSYPSLGQSSNQAATLLHSKPHGLDSSIERNPPLAPFKQPQEIQPKAKATLDLSVTIKAKDTDGTVRLVNRPLSEVHSFHEVKLPTNHVSRLYGIHPVIDHPDNAQEYRSQLLKKFKKDEITEEEYHAHLHNSIEKVKAIQHVEDNGVVHTIGDQLLHRPSQSKEDADKALEEGRAAFLKLKDLEAGEITARLKFINAKPGSIKAIKPKKVITVEKSTSLAEGSKQVKRPREPQQDAQKTIARPAKRVKSIYDRDLTSGDTIEVPAGSPPSFTSKVTEYLEKTGTFKVDWAIFHRKDIEKTMQAEDWQHRFVLNPIFDHSTFLTEKKRRLDQDYQSGKISQEQHSLDKINAEVKAKALDIVDQGGIIRGPNGVIHHPSTMSHTEAYNKYVSSGRRPLIQLRPKRYDANGIRTYQMEILPAHEVRAGKVTSSEKGAAGTSNSVQTHTRGKTSTGPSG